MKQATEGPQGPQHEERGRQNDAEQKMQPSGTVQAEARVPAATEAEEKSASWLVMLLVSLVVMVCLGFGLLYVFGGLPPQITEALPELAFPDRGVFDAFQSQPAPIPVLQEASAEQRIRQTEQERERLNSYGWVDPEANIVHIPVDRASELVIERGLPTRLPSATPTPGN